MQDKLESATQRIDHPELVGGLPEMSILFPPSINLFLLSSGSETDLPDTLAHNTELLKQSEQRRHLYEEFQKVFALIPDVNMDVDIAREKGLITDSHLIQLYDQVRHLLESDIQNIRILLYLPSQILPHIGSHVGSSLELERSQQLFCQVYKKHWIRLLYESDVRANFVDGDVLEPGMGDPERVRKAAHLIPELLAKGLLTVDDITEVLTVTSDRELSQSLLEGLVVAADLSLIGMDAVHNLAEKNGIKSELDRILTKATPAIEIEISRSIEEISLDLTRVLADIELRYAEGSSVVSGISQKRAHWEERVQRDKAIDNAAHMIAKKLLAHEISQSELETIRRDVVIARAVIQTVEMQAQLDLGKARIQAEKFIPYLHNLWLNCDDECRRSIEIGIRHWRRLDVISDSVLVMFQIALPDLSSPYPVDVRQLLTDEELQLTDILNKLETHPELAKSIFPILLVFGSRLKGYAQQNADIDAAVFVRPDVPWESQERIKALLQDEIPSIERVLQFWTHNKNGTFGFRNVEKDGVHVVGPVAIHFLLGGTWIGKGAEMKQVYGDIVAKYLDLHSFGDQKEEARMQLLRQLEVDGVQYRLMHKGYRQSYPSQRAAGTTHADAIDWESDYYDPGYRRIATQLFLSKVFLPDLDGRH